MAGRLDAARRPRRLLVLAALGVAAITLAALWREARRSGWERVESWAPEIRAAAAEAGLDPSLLAGLVYAESRGRADAVSSAGAQGLCQIKPATARELAQQLDVPGAPPYPPAANLRLGARYLRQQMDRWDGSAELGLLAYRLGPGRVGREAEAAGGGAAYLESHRAQATGPWAYCEQVLAAAERFRMLAPFAAEEGAGKEAEQ